MGRRRRRSLTVIRRDASLGPREGTRQLGFILTFPTISDSHLGHGYGTNPGPWTLIGNLDSGNIVPGQWHRVEHYVKLSTSPTLPEGVLRWWIDGVLIGQYCTVNFDSAAFNEIKFSPSWDSQDPTQTHEDSHEFDHVRTSAPSGESSSDTVPPSSPTRLTVQ